MSGLQYRFDTGGPGEVWSSQAHYAQSVTIGSLVKLSGQGGWDSERQCDKSDPKKQVDIAMLNVERVLKEAGLRGWQDVYCVRSYHVGDFGSTFNPLIDALKSYCPDHRPIWTSLGVAGLADPNMMIEIEVEATKQS
jgi:enamine deaminase RidA (YjgF/YER057c/UK114 family)